MISHCVILNFYVISQYLYLICRSASNMEDVCTVQHTVYVYRNSLVSLFAHLLSFIVRLVMAKYILH